MFQNSFYLSSFFVVKQMNEWKTKTYEAVKFLKRQFNFLALVSFQLHRKLSFCICYLNQHVSLLNIKRYKLHVSSIFFESVKSTKST